MAWHPEEDVAMGRTLMIYLFLFSVHASLLSVKGPQQTFQLSSVSHPRLDFPGCGTLLELAGEMAQPYGISLSVWPVNHYFEFICY